MLSVTQILSQLEQGDPAAAEDLLPLVYDELRKLAAAKLAHERSGQTLQATALVHEAYLKLVGNGADFSWDSRGHFFAAAAEAMRRLLIDRARRRQTEKHGGDLQRISLNKVDIPDESRSEDLLALDEAIRRLEVNDPIQAQLVKLKYFAGLTNQQAAAALGIGVSTAERYWAYSRSWLRAEISKIQS
ncbi:ECF-type sigma factor [Novipirellula artificiosorum]|uniref:RNA polymerase sigma factor n=1 Tax=Novipirellula artificiosorum TaxID=2528016 RepID=A0A5C6DVB2_9BACT|nr:ECF-type sigma factor [Novipirellula artificiosorum]TWU39381.1 RNA polymerase sigma factor [Novipirellula artificiosorum]